MNDFPLFYWLIEKWDKETIKVKPENARLIQSLITKGEGFIRTTTRTINVKDVKSFDESDIPYSDQKLLESSSRAFNSELYSNVNDEEMVQAKWVKKPVSHKKYESFYKYNSAYKHIDENDKNIIVAFLVPTHLINSKRVTELTPYEILQNKL